MEAEKPVHTIDSHKKKWSRHTTTEIYRSKGKVIRTVYESSDTNNYENDRKTIIAVRFFCLHTNFCCFTAFYIENNMNLNHAKSQPFIIM